GLAGETLREDDEKGEAVQKEKARAWWERASKVGEEAYLFDNILPRNSNEPNSTLLRVLQKKYPQHLPPLYCSILGGRPQWESNLVARAITRSSLPRRQKVELLTHGVRHEHKGHREAAFEATARLDHEVFVEAVIKLLDELPRT